MDWELPWKQGSSLSNQLEEMVEPEWQVWIVDNNGELNDLVGVGFKSLEEAEIWAEDNYPNQDTVQTNTGY